MPKIKTTLNPHREVEVSEQEYTDLKRQGLVHEQPARKTNTESAQ